MKNKNNTFTLLVHVSILLTLLTVILSAYIRLSTNGLGCEPWPDCYGHVGSMQQYDAASSFRNARPEQPHGFARMLHRLVASTLGLFVVMILISAWRRRRKGGPGVRLPAAILGVTLFLSILGYTTPSPWIPAVAIGNLVGGMTMLAMLWWLGQSISTEAVRLNPNTLSLKPLAKWGLALVMIQITLGAWVSGNYAGPACDGLAFCGGDWAGAINIARKLTVENGMIVADSVMPAVHTFHRIGAIILTAFLGWLGFRIMKSDKKLKTTAIFMLALLGTQILLGITAIAMQFPLGLVTAHNAIAALLLLSLTNLNLTLSRQPLLSHKPPAIKPFA
ncbi:MAG: COX15/CtaA family protein [Proteobacteria bacterium]|nr:COX15/CtaA family protein [Pseudomonadota bacterium]